MKYSKLDLDSEYDSEMDKGKEIIDAEPSVIVATTHIQPEDPKDPEEVEHLFHSQMWVNGVSLHFIVYNGSQKNLISAQVVKRLTFPTMPHLQPYNIGWLNQGQDLYVSQQCHMPYAIKLFKDEVLCDISAL